MQKEPWARIALWLMQLRSLEASPDEQQRGPMYRFWRVLLLSRPASPPQKEAVLGGRSTSPLVRRWPDAVGLAAAVRARAAGGLARTALCLTLGLAAATPVLPT